MRVHTLALNCSGSYDSQGQALTNPIWLVHLPVSMRIQPMPTFTIPPLQNFKKLSYRCSQCSFGNSFIDRCNYKEIGIRSYARLLYQLHMTPCQFDLPQYHWFSAVTQGHSRNI